MGFLQTCAAIYRARDKVLGPIPEPQWRILIDLAENGACPVTSACIASGSPQTTALRHVGELERAGLIERIPAAFDRRSSTVALTDAGRERLAAVAQIATPTQET